MAVTERYELTFGTTLGRTRTLRINNPNTGLSESQINTAMQNMINSNAVGNTTSGNINAIRRANLVTVTVAERSLPAGA